MRAADDKKSLFLRACRCQPVERVPVWIMRQAGRYLPEYRAVREKHSFLEVCTTPELAAEVSLQPYRILDVDVVIVFSDILIPARAMGMELEIADAGPVLRNPIRDASQIAALREFDPHTDTRFVLDAIRLLCRALGPNVPVLGFAAAPWTLACYLIEGRSSDGFPTAKRMLNSEPRRMRGLLEKIARVTAAYLKAQIAAGAAAVQLFDTWAGELSPAEYEDIALPATALLVREIGAGDAPILLYARNAARLLAGLARTGAGVLSVDWRTDLAAARRQLGEHVALQGNVDPRILLGPEEGVHRAAVAAIEQTGGRGHILNLGHGILPDTPVANARAFVRAARDLATLARVPAARGS